MGIKSVLNHAQQLIQDAVGSRDIVIDATVGNGFDTLFLAKCVGNQGKVYGFDIQLEALDHTKQRFSEDKDMASVLHVFQQSHAHMLEMIPQDEQGQISGIMFNLGYLPGYDHQVVTRLESTIPALKASIQLLRKGGILTIILYTGHSGAQEEANAVT